MPFRVDETFVTPVPAEPAWQQIVQAGLNDQALKSTVQVDWSPQ